jgi:PEP-CTERM motif
LQVFEFVSFFDVKLDLARQMLMSLQETLGWHQSLLGESQSVTSKSGAKIMRQFTKSFLAIAALSVAAAANADIVLTFEGLTADGTSASLIGNTNPYTVPFGVTFGPAGAGEVVTVPATTNNPSGVNSLQVSPGLMMSTAASVYGFSFYYTAVAGTSPLTIDVNGNSVILPPVSGATCTPTYPGLCDWNLYTYSGSLGTPLSVTFGTGFPVDYRLFLDNITLVPEPASLALVGLSLVAVGFASRRRRQRA